MKLKINQHYILPSVLNYLLSANITMVNSERNFCKLKKIYNDPRQSLDEMTAAAELAIFNTIKSFRLELSINEIQSLSLKQLLDSPLPISETYNKEDL